MKFTCSVSSESKICFLENEEEVIVSVKRSDKEQRISLRKETILFCSGDRGVFFSDGYELFYACNGCAKCVYKASYKIYELIYIAGMLFIVDENILVSINNNGESVWQYWHYEPIDRMIAKDNYIEFIDENNSSFRISIENGSLQ